MHPGAIEYPEKLNRTTSITCGLSGLLEAKQTKPYHEDPAGAGALKDKNDRYCIT
jgi:hypothetical protein